ncbi:hypothetical protein [Mycolicibacterium thermoresistibile]
MRQFIVLIAGLFTALGLTVIGAGTAGAAPNVEGATYDEASAVIQRMNGVPVIASRYGSQLEQGNCIVTDAWDGSFVRDAQGFPSGAREVMLSLNCNARVAAAGRPGNSVTTPEGKSWKTVEHNAQLINRNPEVCEESADTQAFCIRFCRQHSDMCSYSG